MIKRHSFYSFLLIFVVVSMFCLGLYQFNNKYTYRSLQPECGQLLLSEENLKTVHYLIEDWGYYPDKLLTPEELSSNTAKNKMFYIDIGNYTTFAGSAEDKDPHGCGTYVMHLWLPEHLTSYSLELPEIFSAYRLYINGECYTEVGNPDINNYEASTQTKLVTFRAEEHVEIVITVSDYSHFYSGIVYPPVFGISEEVVKLHDIKTTTSLFVISCGFLLAVVTLYLGLRMKTKNAVLFSFLSLILCLTISFPYMHNILELPVFPCYALELLCIYLMPVFIVTLHNRICNVFSMCKKISTIITVVICIIASFYGLMSAELTTSIMDGFSLLITFYTLALAFYLLITATVALEKHTDQVQLLYFASVAYAVILLWDRILPTFEPIIYGWYTDWGNLILIFAIGLSLIRNLIYSYLRSLTIAEEYRQMSRQLVMQQEYNRQIAAQTEQNRKLIHDFRQHVRIISVLSEQIEATDKTSVKKAELTSYLKEFSNSIFAKSKKSYESFSNNPAIDALLQYYYSYAGQQKIDTDFQWFPSNLPLSDIDMCTVLGNLLENAVDACQKLSSEQKKTIKVFTKETEYAFFICVENTYDGIVKKKRQHFLSRKEDVLDSGIGLESVREIIESHDGAIDIYPNDQIFRVGILLPKSKEG